MNALVPASALAIDCVSEFFAPVNHNALDELLTRRGMIKREIEALGGTIDCHALSVFMKANLERDSHLSVERLFDAKRAMKQLDSDMWHSAMHLTDVWDYMPQARRDQWNKQLRHWKDAHPTEKLTPENDVPQFERDTVEGTLKQLLAMRTQFVSEKVDGIFRGLSGDHVTNSPMGFRKRMIIAHAMSNGFANSSRAGLIDDLRQLIAKFRGMSEHLAISSYDVLRRAHETRTGEWFDVDGGALRIRVYKVGTAHLEVHEDLAWKLNQILASMHPAAIPAEFRQPSKRKVKEFTLFDDILPSVVRSLIGGMRPLGSDGYYFDSGTYGIDKAIIREAEGALEAVGGVEVEVSYKPGRFDDVRKRKVWKFDFYFPPIRDDIAANGRIPNAQSHQFYPTPPALAEIAVGLAEIGPAHTCLEPSAGMGGLADLLPASKTTCVEISPLHCTILAEKRLYVERADFLKWTTGGGKFDRIVMNPPFSEGRWQAHLEHALTMVGTDGRLVAILPSGALSRAKIPDHFTSEWHGPYQDKFKNASVDVVILVAQRKST